MVEDKVSWLKKVETFPVSLLFITNIILASIIASQIYLFYVGYVLKIGAVVEQMATNEAYYYFTDGIERFVQSISAWVLAIFIVNIGSSMFIAKTKKAISELPSF